MAYVLLVWKKMDQGYQDFPHTLISLTINPPMCVRRNSNIPHRNMAKIHAVFLVPQQKE